MELAKNPSCVKPPPPLVPPAHFNCNTSKVTSTYRTCVRVALPAPLRHIAEKFNVPVIAPVIVITFFQTGPQDAPNYLAAEVGVIVILPRTNSFTRTTTYYKS